MQGGCPRPAGAAGLVSPPRAAAPYCRTPLVRLDGVMSSYDADGETGSAWADRVDLAAKSTGWGTEAIRLATRNAQASVLAAGGTMGVTDCYRSFGASARRMASARNPRNVASPGRSNHNAGCSIDIDAYHLGGISMEELHAIVKPLGFSPFRDDYLMKSECWHFDFFGEWGYLYDWMRENRHPSTRSQIARCMILDVGAWDCGEVEGWDDERMEVAYIQAQLQRIAAHEVGKVDGFIGSKTRTALAKVFPEGAQAGDVADVAERRVIADRLNTYPAAAIRQLRGHWRFTHE